MKFKKFYCLLLGIMALLFFVKPASAQQYTVTTLTGVTNSVGATATNTVASSNITLTKYDQVALHVSFNATGAGTDNVVLKLSQSLDGTNFDSAERLTVTVAGNGTNTVHYTTNLTVNSVGYLRLESIENSITNSITNLLIKVAVKPKRNG